MFPACSLFIAQVIYLSLFISIYLSVHPSICPSIHLSVHPSIHLLYLKNPGMGKHNVSGMFSFYNSAYLSISPSIQITIFIFYVGGQDDSLQAELNTSLLSKKSSRTHTHSFSESRNKDTSEYVSAILKIIFLPF